MCVSESLLNEKQLAEKDSIAARLQSLDAARSGEVTQDALAAILKSLLFFRGAETQQLLGFA